MILLLGSLGWGLLTFGAITHVWHHRRLRQLLAMHVDHEVPLAVVVTAAEVGLSVAIPVTYLAGGSAVRWISLPATALAVGFVLWIARLLISKSDLPCACSFAETPTTIWSLARACCAALVVLFAFADPSGQHVPTTVATLFVSLAMAGAIFVLPEALSWPSTSRALLRRIDAHRPDEPTDAKL